MIAKQKIHKGNNFMGAFDYNDKKMRVGDKDQRAELLDHNFMSYDRQVVSKEMFLLQQLRPNLTRDAYHVSLNFAPEDKITKERLLAITKEYMIGMGFDDNLYAIWQHHDADHLHVHLLCSRIRFDGLVVSDSNNYKRSEKLCREQEKKYDLTPVIGSKEAKSKAPSKDEIEMVLRTEQPSRKMLLQEKVLEAREHSASLKEFIENCQNNGVYLLFNQSQTTGRVSGITYVTDGLVARGQALGNIFKWNNVVENLDYEQNRDRQTISEANFGTREKFATILDRNLSNHSRGQKKTDSNSTESERSSALIDGHRREQANAGGSAINDKEAGGIGSISQEMPQNTDVDILRTLHSISSGLFSSTGASTHSEVDDEQRKRRKRKR